MDLVLGLKNQVLEKVYIDSENMNCHRGHLCASKQILGNLTLFRLLILHQYSTILTYIKPEIFLAANSALIKLAGVDLELPE